MLDNQLITACIKNDTSAQKRLFELQYGKLAAIARRYAKNNDQATEITHHGFAFIFANLPKFKNQIHQNIYEWISELFIISAVQYIRNIRSEYFVASTVRATENNDKSYDLFIDSVITDFKRIDFDVLVKSLQQLVPSQRLVFNLHVVEGYDLNKTAEILEASEQTVKSNLEKARYSLQKNIDKNTKALQNEQLV